MWTYSQSSGELCRNGEHVGNGYSGAGPGKNNPAMQNIPDVGPIPQGVYSIGKPIASMVHGPFALPLTPYPRNAMFGRSGFLIHGDSLVAPGTASEGCIIMARVIRNQIAASGDFTLTVRG